MELELMSVRRWFSKLQIMQTCAKKISHDTPDDLAKFYSTPHVKVMAKPEQQANFAFCVFRNAQISVTDQDFTAASSFHELLDEAHRSLRVAVRELIRAIAIEKGSVPVTEDPQKFELRKSKDVFDSVEKTTFLCETLASVMPIFPQASADQASFAALVAKPASTIKDAIDAAVKES